MKAVLRSAVVVAAAASSVAMMGAPADAAPGGGAFHGTAFLACFGCGVSHGTADLKVTGTVNGVAHVEADATATYATNDPVGATCVISGSASGSVSGAVNVDFNWTRVGAAAVISTSGDINGNGVGVFVAHVTGLPCGTENLTADVAGSVFGL